MAAKTPYVELTPQFVSPVQQSMQVPQTPLHTSRVLKEEKDLWEDVKVTYLNASSLLFATCKDQGYETPYVND